MVLFDRFLAKRLEKGFAEISEGAGGFEFIGNQAKTPKFSSAEAVKQYKSWTYNAATRNAVATSSATLRLFATRGSGESMPKIAPYAPITKQREAELKAANPRNSAVRNAEDIVEITEHPFLDLMENPNPFRTEEEFRQETSLFADLTGNTYWFIQTGSGVMAGIPEQLWILPTQITRIVPDPKKFIKGYLYGKVTKEKALFPEEVMHIRRPNPSDMWYGKGRVEGAWDAIHGSEALDNYENSTARYPIPAMFLKYKKSLQASKRREILSEADRAIQYQARSQSYLAGVFDSDAELEKLSFAPKEVVALQGRKWYRQAIVEAFGQTLSLYDTQAARATIEGAIYLWARFELDPTNQLIAGKINTNIIPRYDGGDRLFCAFDPITREDAEFALKRDTEDRKASIRTINEVRHSRGLPESDDERADDLFAKTEKSNPIELASSKLTATKNKSASTTISTDDNRLAGSRPTFDGKAIHATLEGVPVWIS